MNTYILIIVPLIIILTIVFLVISSKKKNEKFDVYYTRQYGTPPAKPESISYFKYDVTNKDNSYRIDSETNDKCGACS
jgi:hypothetical protein